MFVVCVFVNIGMWFERFVIIVTSLSPRLPAVERGATSSRRGSTSCTFLGQLRPVLHAVPAVLRFLPMVAMAEVKAVLPQADAHPPETEPERRASRTLAAEEV